MKSMNQDKGFSSFWRQVVTYCLALFCAVSIGLVSGCGMPQQVQKQVHQQVTRTLTDGQGKEVQVPEHPNRIVSIGVSTDDIVITLVGTDRIVAISDLPPNLEQEAETIKGRVKANTESVMSFKPDLVIVPSWISADFVAELRALDIPVYVYSYPKNVMGTERLITELGDVVNEKEKARQLRSKVEMQLTNLQAFTAKIPKDEQKVAIQYTKNGIVGGEGSSFASAAQAAGLIDGAQRIGLKDNEQSGKETLVRINPDIIFIPSGAYNKDQYKAIEAEQIYTDPAFQGVKAVQNHQIYVIDAKWLLSYSQFNIKAIELMAKDAYSYKIPEV